MLYTVTLNDWTQLRLTFESFFAPFGSVTLGEESLTFRSRPPHVETGFSIGRDGRMGATMPLHQIDAVFTQIDFDPAARQVTCHADGLSYTYRVPPQL